MNAARSIPAQIVDYIHTEGLAVGSHLPAQVLADRLHVSRTPINDALRLLHDQGMLTREPNRGYFVAKGALKRSLKLSPRAAKTETDTVTRAYFRVADDRLKGLLPDHASEAQLRSRYDLTGAQLHAVLNRIAQEGWVQKRPGYGWVFSSMLTTPDSLLQSYRLRAALEPAALLEPGYRLDPRVIERCRAAELDLLNGGIQTATADQLHERGVRFHESLVEASGNPFFIDTIRRVNRVRRLLSYRSMQDRERYAEHCRQHLRILELLEKGRCQEASDALRIHLSRTLKNLEKISRILEA